MLGVALSGLLMVSACGGDETPDNSNQTCNSTHSCTNGACACTTSGKDGTSCKANDDTTASDADKCEAKCKVCS